MNFKSKHKNCTIKLCILHVLIENLMSFRFICYKEPSENPAKPSFLKERYFN